MLFHNEQQWVSIKCLQTMKCHSPRKGVSYSSCTGLFHFLIPWYAHTSIYMNYTNLYENAIKRKHPIIRYIILFHKFIVRFHLKEILLKSKKYYKMPKNLISSIHKSFFFWIRRLYLLNELTENNDNGRSRFIWIIIFQI